MSALHRKIRLLQHQRFPFFLNALSTLARLDESQQFRYVRFFSRWAGGWVGRDKHRGHTAWSLSSNGWDGNKIPPFFIDR